MKHKGLWMKYKRLRISIEGLWRKIGVKNSVQHLPQEEAIACPHAQKVFSKLNLHIPMHKIVVVLLLLVL